MTWLRQELEVDAEHVDVIIVKKSTLILNANNTNLRPAVIAA